MKGLHKYRKKHFIEKVVVSKLDASILNLKSFIRLCQKCIKLFSSIAITNYFDKHFVEMIADYNPCLND